MPLHLTAPLRLTCFAVFVGSLHSFSMENPCKYHNDATCTQSCREMKLMEHGYCKGDHCECTMQPRAAVDSSEPDPCKENKQGDCFVACTTSLSFDIGQCVGGICHCLNMNQAQPGTRLRDAKQRVKQGSGPKTQRPVGRTLVEPKRAGEVPSTVQETWKPLRNAVPESNGKQHPDPCRQQRPDQCNQQCVSRLKFQRGSCIDDTCWCGRALSG